MTYDLHKARRDLVLGRTTDGSEEVVSGGGVVELNSTQTCDVEEPAGSLCRVARWRGVNLGQELVGLVIEVGLEVGAEEEVDDGNLEDLVFAQLCRLTNSQQCPVCQLYWDLQSADSRSEFGKLFLDIIRAREVKVYFGRNLVHRTPVCLLDHVGRLEGKLARFGNLSSINGGENEQ